MQSKFDKILYSISTSNNTQESLPCTIDGILRRNIIPSNLTDYQVCVKELVIPTYDLPLMIYPHDSSLYKIVVDFNPTPGVIGSKIYTSDLNTGIDFRSRSSSNSHKIYQISQWTDMLNYALLKAIIDVDTQYNLDSGLHLPRYNASVSGGKCYANCFPSWHYGTSADYFYSLAFVSEWGDIYDLAPEQGGSKGGMLNMYFNRPTYLKMAGIKNFTTDINPKNFRILYTVSPIESYGPDAKIYIDQQWHTLATISDISSIQVITNLPVQNTYSEEGNINNILLNISPEINQSTFGSALHYDVTFPFDFKDIVSPAQMDEVWFRVYYITVSVVNGSDTYQLRLPPQSGAKITLLFQKKSTSNY